jgi:P-type conjugative transfer protein TrbJ
MKKMITAVLFMGIGFHPLVSFAILGIADTAVVFDPSNYASNLIQQYEAVKNTIANATMIANQAMQLEHEAQSLVYQAQNLQKNPLQLLEQLRTLWNQYNGVLRDADGLTYALVQSGAKFQATYPDLVGTDAGTTIADISAASSRMLGSIRKASQSAIKSQSIYERLCQQLDAEQQALAAAQTAQGALQIAQAQAQLQGLTNEQLATLAQIEATNGRVTTEWIMKQAADEEAGRARQERWVSGFGAQGFHAIREGQGVPLP